MQSYAVGDNMDEKFGEAIKLYISIVEEACNTLIDYINEEEFVNILNKYDLYAYISRNRKFEFILGEYTYYFHGVGCTVFFHGVPFIEWDFGYRSWWCGIEPFKMAKTLKSFSYKEVSYCDEKYIKSQCDHYLSKGLLNYYKGQYYVDLLKVGTKRMKFPVDYEKVIIQYKEVAKSYPKSKIIDKFIRKSNIVYKGISELKNNYILVFYDKDSVVARVPYNDIAYPDAAVKIMNEQIIKPHQVEQWKV